MNLEGHYIYCHFNPLTDEPFYVGQGETLTRPWDMKKRGNIHKNYVEKHGVRVEVIIDGLTKESADFWEIRWIKALKEFGYNLKNLTAGGDGVDSESAKIIQNRPEVKANNSAKQKIAQNRPEVKAKRIAGILNAISNRTSEKEEAIRQNKIAAQNRPEVKAKHAKTSARPDVKAKRSAAQRNPEMCAERVKKIEQTIMNKSPSARSDSAKKAWETKRKNGYKLITGPDGRIVKSKKE
jgi:hypothetical protein